MEFKDIFYDTADKLAKKADSMVKYGELVIDEKLLRSELEKKYTQLGKMMFKWYMKEDMEFDELEKYLKDIGEIRNKIKKIHESMDKNRA